MPIALPAPPTANPRTVYVIRNIENRRYSIQFAERPAVIAFTQRPDAEFFKHILDTQYEQTGIWPMISLHTSLDVYRYTRGSAHSSAFIDEEDLAMIELDCGRCYIPIFLVSEFRLDEMTSLTRVRGRLISRSIDDNARLYLASLLD